MKIELSLLNAVRFETGESTRLHVHTRNVDPQNTLLIRPDVGPNFHLKRRTEEDAFPVSDAATPYGAGRAEMTAFVFGTKGGFEENFATTAGTSTPELPEDLDLTSSFRMSLFLRPDEVPSDIKLIAGVPGRFCLYQQNDALKLRLHTSDTEGDDFVCDAKLTWEAWQLLEVQWSDSHNGGQPMWFVNGVSHPRDHTQLRGGSSQIS